MRWLVGIIGWVVEAGILAGLVWKYRSSFDLRIHEDAWWLAPIAVAYLAIAVVQWVLLRRRRLGRAVWLRLCLLTGPCALGSLLMAVDLTGRLSALAHLERDAAGTRTVESETGALKDGTLLYSQERMESERALYLMLCGGMCLLYAHRRSAAANEGGWRNVGSSDRGRAWA